MTIRSIVGAPNGAAATPEYAVMKSSPRPRARIAVRTACSTALLPVPQARCNRRMWLRPCLLYSAMRSSAFAPLARARKAVRTSTHPSRSRANFRCSGFKGGSPCFGVRQLWQA